MDGRDANRERVIHTDHVYVRSKAETRSAETSSNADLWPRFRRARARVQREIGVIMVPAQTEIQDISSERITLQARRLKKEECQMTRSENTTPSSTGRCLSSDGPLRLPEEWRPRAQHGWMYVKHEGPERAAQSSSQKAIIRSEGGSRRKEQPCQLHRRKLMRMRTRLAGAEAWKMQAWRCPPSQWHWCATTGGSHHGCRSCGCSLSIARKKSPMVSEVSGAHECDEPSARCVLRHMD